MEQPYLLLLVQMKGKEIQAISPVKEINLDHAQALSFVIEDDNGNRFYIPAKRVKCAAFPTGE